MNKKYLVLKKKMNYSVTLAVCEDLPTAMIHFEDIVNFEKRLRVFQSVDVDSYQTSFFKPTDDGKEEFAFVILIAEMENRNES